MINNLLNNLKMYSRFCFGLRVFLKEKMTFESAKQIIKTRMEQREANFLNIVKKGVFEYKKSPYLALFKLCHCEYNDIVKLVSRHGLQETLNIIRDDGVYIKIDELKGLTPIIRRGNKFIVREADFNNPFVASCYEKRTGASRGVGTKVELNFDFLSDTAVHRGLISYFWDLEKAAHIIIRPPFPYGPGMMYMLQLSKFGITPKRWISLIDERHIPISLRSRLGVCTTLFLSRIYGKQFPRPEFIDRENICKVAELIADYSKRHQECCVFTNVSSAFRICLAAKENKINFSRVKFQGCGEPLTEVKNDLIESVGAKYILYYAFTEAGLAGSLCLNPTAIDDIHVFSDFLYLMSYKRLVRDAQVDAILCTTLLPSAPKILINAESGDYGIIENKECGCPYDELGFSGHIHYIRSFEKLTGEGATFYGTNIMRIIEEVLPRQFGGSGLDYQLIEEEDSEGLTRLTLVVNPTLSRVDEDKIIETLLNELRKDGDSQKVMAEVWNSLGAIKVKRDYPRLTPAGKMFPLHILSNKRKG